MPLFMPKINAFLASVFCSFFALAAMESTPSAVNYAELTQALDHELDRLVETTKHQLRVAEPQPPANWLSYNNLDRANGKTTFKCYPFVQGAVFPAGTNLVVVGDVHGYADALDMILAFIAKNQATIAPNPHYVFLGDYANRWRDAVHDSDDTLAYHRVLTFYNDHHEHVTLLRGNHEDIQALRQFSSFRENPCIIQRFGATFEENCALSPMPYKIATSYEFLPAAFFAGCRTEHGPIPFIQFCHGGIEPTYNPQALLCNIPTHPNPCCQFVTNLANPNPPQMWAKPRFGLLWNSFSGNDHDVFDRRHHSTHHGLPCVDQYLANSSFLPDVCLCGIFGGHQHYDEMLAAMEAGGGLATLWGGKAHVLVSAYPELWCISFSVITLAERPENWILTQHTHRPGDTPGHFNITYHGPVFDYFNHH